MPRGELDALVTEHIPEEMQDYAGKASREKIDSKWSAVCPDIVEDQPPLSELMRKLVAKYDELIPADVRGNKLFRASTHIIFLLTESCELPGSEILQAKIFALVLGSTFRSHASRLFRYYNGALTQPADKLPKSEDVLFMEESLRLAQAIALGGLAYRHIRGARPQEDR